nr:class I SAM-dependent DNA methyltransferase [Longimicrobium terrae]
MSTTIKSIQDVMRKDVGVDGDAQRLGQLGWMLFLKIFDDRDQERELLDAGYVSPIPRDLRWCTWAANPEGITGDALLEFVNGVLFPTLKALPPSPRAGDASDVVRGVFEDAYNYMKSGTLLRQVVNRINGIDFNRSHDRHLFNDLYEQILRDLQSAGNAGEYYTPRAVTQFMVEMADPRLGEKIMDPACGTGGFLVNALEYVRGREVRTVEQEAQLQRSLFGVEPLPHLLCTTNLLLHGMDVPAQVRRDNTLRIPLSERTARDRVEVIVTNPPFGGEEEHGIEDSFPAKFRTRETADLFLVLIIHLLQKDTGRAAVVLPDGFLFGEGIKTRIKEKLLEECNLHTIVRLPKGVFAPYTSIHTNLLFFAKGKKTEEVWFYEHPYPAGQKSYSKTRPIRSEEFDAERAWWNARQENEHAWRVPVEEIRRRNYNLDIKNPNAAVEEYRDPEELLAEYRQILGEVQEAREALKRELATALEPNAVTEAAA